MSNNTAMLRSSELSNMTVALLKILCKSRNIAGYSKLTKSALIKKILESNDILPPELEANASGSTNVSGVPKETCTISNVAVTSTTVVSKAVPPSGKAASKSRETPVQSRTVERSAGERTQVVIDTTPTQTANPQITRHQSQALIESICPSTTSTGIPLRNKDNSGVNALIPTRIVPMRRAHLPPDPVEVAPAKKRKGSPTISIQRGQAVALGRTKPASAVSTTQNTKGGDPDGLGVASKQNEMTSTRKSQRFRPLVIKRGSKAPAPPYHGAQEPPMLSRIPLAVNGIITHQPAPLYHLDFPDPPFPKLETITPSPSLAQRKQIPIFALTLSGISEKELKVCARVSKLIRYAAYIGASYKLIRCFHGRRLDSILGKHSPKTTNLWPYLLLREQEVRTRKKAFDVSFMGRMMKGYSPVSEHLWSSPDHERQITIALRFVLTRLFFSISVGSEHVNEVKGMKVLNVEEIIQGEIWRITTVSSNRPAENFYVLESTCEVIGCCVSDQTTKPNQATTISLRTDWTSYIENKLLLSKQTDSHVGDTLVKRIKWTNHEEYDQGISKLWLRRVKGEHELGVAKKFVAERYVMACVFGNSGRWMSSSEMAQEFNGLSARGPEVRLKQSNIQLFLPAHHHVESVHFTIVNGYALHPALAVVQTPGRAYYILRDNGMQVGCEEEGVADVWMKLLGCNRLGSPTCTLVL